MMTKVLMKAKREKGEQMSLSSPLLFVDAKNGIKRFDGIGYSTSIVELRAGSG